MLITANLIAVNAIFVRDPKILESQTISKFQYGRFMAKLTGSGKAYVWPEANESGFIPIQDKGDDIFYWYFPARNSPETAPLVLWMTGGPGCSSELAIFYENGPFSLKQTSDDQTLYHNPHAWNTNANLLYVDQPVGTGFSRAAKKGEGSDYRTDEQSIARDMNEFLIGFLKKHPELRMRPFYITGESYAGKYVPTLGAYLDTHKNDEDNKSWINLRGVAIGNGWVKPTTQIFGYANFAYENKLIGETQRLSMIMQFWKCKLELKFNRTRAMGKTDCDKVTAIVGDLNSPFNEYDIRKKCSGGPLCYNFDNLTNLINNPDVIASLGIEGRKWEMCSDAPNAALSDDEYRSAEPAVQQLVNNDYLVWVYSGDKDYACNWFGGRDWTNGMEWKHQKEYLAQKFDDCDYGSCQGFKNFRFIKVANSGHMVPMDQPELALQMLTEFLNTPTGRASEEMKFESE